MNVPAHLLDRRPSLEGHPAFTDRVRPLVEAALRESVAAVPDALGPARDAVGAALGVGVRGGRRWRPVLTLAVTEALGGEAEAALDAAVAVELTHTASLVLDDLPCMDDSPERRGIPATHALVGSAGAILVAVGLLARSAELLGRTPRCGAELARIWGDTFGFAGMAGGQAVDLIRGGGCRGAERRLYRRKTTALAAFAVETGALVGGAAPGARRTLRRFGREVGWAYQLLDDANDRAEDRASGRAPGGRSPLRQAGRLLERGLRRVQYIPGLAPGGDRLLADTAREIVPIPPLASVEPHREAPLC